MLDTRGARRTRTRKAYLWACGLVVAAGIVAAMVGLNRRSAVGHPEGAEVASTDSQSAPAKSPSDPSGDAEEVRRLRAQLHQKDAMLRALLMAPKTEGAAPAQPAATRPPPEDPEARAADLLDERMFAAPKNPATAREMEQALRQIADSRTLGDAKVAALQCGPTMCKLALAAEKPETVALAMSSVMDRLPKRFGAATVYRLGGGQSALYVGGSAEDLALPSENEARP